MLIDSVRSRFCKELGCKILKDVRWGAGWGLFLGVFYAVIGGIIYLLQGSPEVGDFNLLTLTVLYLVAGASGGATAGLFRPTLKQRRAATLVGMLTMLPMAAGTIVLYKGPISTWGATEVLSVVVTAALLGGFGGYWIWKEFHDFDPRTYIGACEDPQPDGGKRGPSRAGKRADRKDKTRRKDSAP